MFPSVEADTVVAVLHTTMPSPEVAGVNVDSKG
jgi:hypothetical protein